MIVFTKYYELSQSPPHPPLLSRTFDVAAADAYIQTLIASCLTRIEVNVVYYDGRYYFFILKMPYNFQTPRDMSFTNKTVW